MSAEAARVLLVTGAVERAGAQIALAFAERGDIVYANHFAQPQQAEALSALAADRGLGGRIRPIEADISEAAAVELLTGRILRDAGRIDVLIHNASSFRPRPFLELSTDEVDASLGVNLRGPLFLSQAVGRAMMAQGSGRILAILGNSLSEAWPDLVPHVVGKSALGRLMEQLAVAYSPTIACNCIAPSQFFRSGDGVNDALRIARGEDPVVSDETTVKGIRIRETRLQDVIQTLMFLADAPASLTGATIPIDGARRLV